MQSAFLLFYFSIFLPLKKSKARSDDTNIVENVPEITPNNKANINPFKFSPPKINIANTTKGVDKSYAIQAGREIRVAVKPNQVKDDEIPMLAREIAKKIEAELEYPGNIKVNVVRETRAIDYAK